MIAPTPRFAAQLLRWYFTSGRSLPWRGQADPYRVWVSEIMLQQTRVDTVVPYYERWMKRFPTVRSLARAQQGEVLRAWEGLGYYSRARNLHRAAQVVVQQFSGRLPSDARTLLKLPGVGPYTAGAIASMAFGLDEPSLDANVRRVLARVFNVTQVADSPTGRREILSLAMAILPPGRAGDFNQALMDLGATVCLPRGPRCKDCPVARHCEANRLGIQSKLPVLAPRKRTPHFFVVAAVVRRRGRVLIAQRPSRGLLGGMWEFPNARLSTSGSVFGGRTKEHWRALDREYGIKVRKGAPLGLIRHAYSHFRVTVLALECEVRAVDPDGDLRWVRIADLNRHPMGRIDRRIAGMLGP